MASRRSILVRWMVFVILAVLSIVGCSKQADSPPMLASKPVIYGASSPTAAVRGFLVAVRDGNTKQAVAYWEFPKKGTEAYKFLEKDRSQAWRPSYKARAVAQASKHRLDWPKLPISRLKWIFVDKLYILPSGNQTDSVKSANWAAISVSDRPGPYGAPIRYFVHKSRGRWRLVARYDAAGAQG